MKKRLLFITLILFTSIALQAQEKQREIEIKTNLGDFTVTLYNETPIHRDNFINLVQEGAYNGMLFHRVIKNFMVQAGGAMRGNNTEAHDFITNKHSEMLPAEIQYPKLFHKRGALAAARVGNEMNPEFKSDPIEFYVVVGEFFLENELEQYSTPERGEMPDQVKEVYMTQGGTPHLDTQYTVFGEVIKGFKTIEKIQNVETDTNGLPHKEVIILSAKLLN